MLRSLLFAATGKNEPSNQKLFSFQFQYTLHRMFCPTGQFFDERLHHISLALDLEAFNDRPYDEIIAGLEDEEFQFMTRRNWGEQKRRSASCTS